LLPVIETPVITELLRQLVKIPSINPPGKEAPLAEFLVEWSKQRGLEVKLDEVFPNRSNVYVTLKGKNGNPKLLYNSHMDVVPEGRGWTVDPFESQIREGRLYGRGSADTKGSLAAMLTAMEAISKSDLSLAGDLILSAVVDEEEAGKGTQVALANGVKGDFAVVGEPTSLQIVVASKGDAVFEISNYGETAHSSMPEKGVNAISGMMQVIRSIHEYADRLRKMSHPYLGSPSISVTVIEGGSSPWIIPDLCKIIVDRRILPGEDLQEVQTELESVCRSSLGKSERMEFRCLLTADPSEISPKERIVQVISEEVKRICGSFNLTGLSGTTDARFLVSAGIPTVIFGPGSLSVAHRPDEYVSIDEVSDAARVLSRVAVNLLA
jgi:acetylornithine deacetylase/succinyl-diaminopimelate desuccinylase family protein